MEPKQHLYQRQILREAENAARSLGFEILSFEAHNSAEIDAAFGSMETKHAEALHVLGDPVLNSYEARITELAMRARLPSASGNKDFAVAGGLLAYGPSYYDLARRAAYYVDRILKGVKPANLPVERAAKFDLTINLKTANALGLTLPPSLLARADEVIE